MLLFLEQILLFIYLFINVTIIKGMHIFLVKKPFTTIYGCTITSIRYEKPKCLLVLNVLRKIDCLSTLSFLNTTNE